MGKKILSIFFLFQGLVLGSEIGGGIDFPVTLPSFPDTPGIERPEIPLIPINPSLPTQVENVDEDGNIRHLEKNFTVLMESKVNIFVPLEIVSDISVNATVLGDETVQVPFEIELNREPEKKDFYKIVYSEKEIDIDNDGRIDTFIYSPEFANTRVIKDNYVEVQGRNISKDGQYQKKVYVTIEAGI